MFLERYVRNARHVEMQVFGFGDGHAVHCFERECSIQRRFQKIVEESPSPGLTSQARAAMSDAAVALARQERYRSAGTIEFVLDDDSGAWLTSTYYMSAPPRWVLAFNGQDSAKKYLNQEWKDTDGAVLASTKPHNFDDGKPVSFYELVGSTPFGNDYEFDFARELIQQEKLGNGTVTDLLVISLSANDILGHMAGPDAPEMRAMALALDRQIADFVTFLNQQYGQGQFWLALTADHGIAPLQATDKQLKLPGGTPSSSELRTQLNKDLATRLRKQGEYIRSVSYPIVFVIGATP